VQRWRSLYERSRRNSNIIFFLGGFLFDALTITRIDAIADLAVQIGYLSSLTLLLLFQSRHSHGLWSPGKWTSKLWPYNVEVLHFLYGGLLSAYVVLYFKSSSGLKAILFLIFLAVLMVLNELPPFRHWGSRVRLALYGFCVASFLIYFIPILIGRVNDWVFLASLALSALLVWWVAKWIVAPEPDPAAARVHLSLPVGALFATMAALHLLGWIPPVPLSVQHQGIYHSVRRIDGKYWLRYPAPPFWAFWRDDSEPFQARDGDSVYYFARIYAPARFRHDVLIRWEVFDERREAFVTTDLRPLSLVGGRLEGFRGYMAKSNYRPGLWRVGAETQDGRTIGSIRFRIRPDDSRGERKWAGTSM
jgi:hypothetical protein